MKVYELQTDWRGLQKGTKLYGPYPLAASSQPCYCTQENIPPSGQDAHDGFFESSILRRPDLFKDITTSQPTKNPA